MTLNDFAKLMVKFPKPNTVHYDNITGKKNVISHNNFDSDVAITIPTDEPNGFQQLIMLGRHSRRIDTTKHNSNPYDSQIVDTITPKWIAKSFRQYFGKSA